MRRLTALLLLAVLAPAAPRRLSETRQIEHALSRLSWGARPGDVERVRRQGLQRWIEEQLYPERIAENPRLAELLAPLETLALDAREMARRYPPPQLLRAYASGRLPLPQDPAERARIERLIERNQSRKPPGERLDKVASALPPAARRKLLESAAPAQAIAYDLLEAKVYRALYSNRQLEDVLTDFWFNHFNVFLDKGADRYLVTSYERDAIRPHVLGRFRDLLQATAEHPAMLFYLDNWQSGTGRRGLNENYARELLELHTLGVDGGCTQKDVTEVARCFTGWTIAGDPYRSAGFQFDPRRHDPGEKVVLGVRIEPGGKDEGEKVLDLLARHPATARFLSRKLAERFVADNPPERLVRAMASTFEKTGGDLRAVMKTMLASKDFFAPEAWRAKLKSPFEMVVSALRASDAEVTFGFGIARRVADMGQPLYRKAEPTGYPNTGEEWLNSAGLVARMNFASALEKGQIAGVKTKARAAGFGAPEFQRR